MNHFSSDLLQAWTGGAWFRGLPPAQPVTGFSNDTRSLAAGECFVALQTPKRDGHDFLGDALAAGAGAALVERPVADCALPQLVVKNALEALRNIAREWRLRYPAPLIGITGSVGKTSTKDMLGAMLGAEGFVTKGNLNNFLGVPLMLLSVEPERHRAGAAIEAGTSEAGELEHSASTIRPDIALITNVHAAHIGKLGSLEAIAREKSAMGRHVRENGAIIFPATLLAYADFAALAPRATVVVFDDEPAPSLKAAATVRARIIESDAGYEIRLTGDLPASFADAGTELAVRFAQATSGMARNAALATLAALCAGIAPARIREVLTAWKPSARRGETLLIQGRLFYVDCYNASPVSMLDSAREFDRRTRQHPQPRLFVIGGMNELGEQSRAMHEQLGRELPLREGDSLVLFGGDADAVAGGVNRDISGVRTHLAATIDEVREIVAAAPGAVFLKGSRAYKLEEALPLPAATAVAGAPGA